MSMKSLSAPVVHAGAARDSLGGPVARVDDVVSALAEVLVGTTVAREGVDTVTSG